MLKIDQLLSFRLDSPLYQGQRYDLSCAIGLVPRAENQTFPAILILPFNSLAFLLDKISMNQDIKAGFGLYFRPIFWNIFSFYLMPISNIELASIIKDLPISMFLT